MATATASFFRENVMVGLTHDENMQPIIRVPKSLKVGIGIPRGKALRVFIHPTDVQTPWYLGEGYYEGRSLKEKWHKFKDRASCEAAYNALRDRSNPAVPECIYPRKLKFFTFSKPTVTERGAEAYEPDFDAIEAHGPTPTRIPIIFTSHNVYRLNYQMWSATEMKCKGDGINAMRAVSMGSEADPLWAEAKTAGERYFPIVNGCMERGCPYGEKRECKPGLTLSFQAANLIQIGTSATYHTTGWRSSQEIFSSIEAIRDAVILATGRDIGALTAYLTMRPYLVHPEGQKAATQYAVHVELPVKAQKSLVAGLRAMFEDEPKLLDPPRSQGTTLVLASDGVYDAEPDTEGETEGDAITASAMAAEFYPESAAQDGAEQAAESFAPSPASTTAAHTSTNKQASVGDKLRNRKQTINTVTVPESTLPEKTTPTGDTSASQSALESLPWKDATEMTRMINAERFRVGDQAFRAALDKLGCPLNDLKPDSAPSLSLFKDLKALPNEDTAGVSKSGFDDMF